MRSRAPYIHITQELVHALTLYGRLSGTEWAVVMTVAHYTMGWNRAEFPIGLAMFEARMPGISHESIRRSLRHLATDAGTTYQKHPGHGVLVIGSKAEAQRSTVWSIQTDWTRWGWPAETDRDRISEILADYAIEVLPETYSQEAVEAALLLREISVDQGGASTSAPRFDPDSQKWRRWCLSMDAILGRSVHPSTLQAVLAWARSDEFWASRLVGADADRKAERNFDQLLAQWRAASRSRRLII